MRSRIKTVAAVAVVGVLATAGAAEGQRLITGALIKNSTVTGKDVRNGSLGLADLSRSARRALRGARGPAGPQGVPGARGANGVNGAPGANGVTDIFYVDSPLVPVAAGTASTAIAVCPAGSVATGGSEGPDSDAAFSDLTIYFVFPEGYAVTALNTDTVTANLQARVACARR
jgi:hypothetical protein